MTSLKTRQGDFETPILLFCVYSHVWPQSQRRRSFFVSSFFLWCLNYLILQKLIFESSEAVSVISTFDDLSLKEDLLRGIYAYSMSFISLFVYLVLDLRPPQTLKNPLQYNNGQFCP
jgi:hypothetical protein